MHGQRQKTMHGQSQTINKEIENIKINQKEILELKGIIIEKETLLEGLTCRFEQMEKKKRISKLEDKTITFCV